MFHLWVSWSNFRQTALGVALLLCASLAPHAMAADLTAESTLPSVFFNDSSSSGLGWQLFGEDNGDGDGQGFFYLRDKFNNFPFHIHRPSSTGSNDTALVISANGSIGLGRDPPARHLHMWGHDAVFRMDRPSDTAAFMLVRTHHLQTFMPMKTFVVGTNATDYDNGEFVINDLGTAVGGPGTRRMTIGNTGNVTFTGNVTALSFIPSSSERLKKDISTLTQARDAVEKLRGVRFAWKESGQVSVGLIAEEVAKVFPELVSFENGQAQGVNYSALVAVLIEALKEQDAALNSAEKSQATLVEALKHQQGELALLKTQRQTELAATNARLAELEQMILGKRAMLEPR